MPHSHGSQKNESSIRIESNHSNSWKTFKLKINSLNLK